MDRAAASGTVFRFGLFEADAARGTLSRGGARVKIQEQPFRLLLMLLERPGEVVTREALRQGLWPEGTFVDFDGSLNVILKRLRAAIDDDPENARFIETIPRRGYRFIAPVEVKEPEGPSPTLSPQDRGNGEARALKIPAGEYGETVGSMLSRARLWLAPAVVVSISLIVVIGIRVTAKKTVASGPEFTPKSSLAVMPFSNGGAGPSFDYLRYALASDIVTDLGYARSISVRPFASTTKYADAPADPQTVGQQMKVTYVVSGDFVNEGGRLKVTTELTRVSDDTVVWRDSVSAPANELVRLHEELTERLQDGVIARVGGAPITNEIPVPHRPRAYDMYLRAVAMPRDPTPNRTAIALLTEGISEDPEYAPAWSELAWRYYLDAEYSGGGESSYRLSEEATARATALDPNGTTNAVAQKAEHGDLQGAYDEAQALLSRRPDSSDAHFEMSYVYRYAGLLDGAARECDAALSIDPGNFLFRSCSKVFMYQGKKARAQAFFDLDGNSGWSVRQEMQGALREKKDDAFALALAITAMESGYKDVEIVVANLEHKPPNVISKIAVREEADVMNQSDAEEKYETAAMLSSAGETGRAIKILKSAIATGYCGTPLLDIDPLLSNVRQQPDFEPLKTLATRCQQNLLTHIRRENSHAMLSSNASTPSTH